MICFNEALKSHSYDYRFTVRITYILFYNCRYERGRDGKAIIYNETEVFHTQTCCDGHTGIYCEIDLCKNLTCSEDLDSICVVTRRCGERFPVFVTSQGIISENCTQPQESELHLRPNDISVCKNEMGCLAHPDGDAICFGSRCDCSPGPVWLLHNGRDAVCSEL